MDNLILIGMPASGKSAAGKRIAAKLGWSFADGDDLIRAAEKRTLPEIIAERGTEGFLETESRVLCALSCDKTVIATGGSAVYSPSAMAHLKRLGKVVYFKIGAEELARRIPDLAARGVVMRGGIATLEALSREREPLYARYADVTVDCRGLAAEEIADAALAAVQGVNMNYKQLAERLLPGEYPPLETFETKYPPRSLPDRAEVTRLAPSPTGFIHLGNLFAAIANERIAHRSGGILYLRIEDTDLKRKVDGAVEAVIKALDYFDIRFDEGAEIGADDTYAPWYQRQRADIYRAYAKSLIERGRAYPCFCTEEELTALREEQTAKKEITGYYGKYAKCRDLSEEEIYQKLDEGKPYVIRLKSLGNPENKLKFRDAVKGEITVTENDQDVVILKSDGIPTYHFAHAVDDHLMRTTLVIRGEEWLASLPIHIELFEALGFRPPRYGHNCSLMKQDGETRRKLSKRKDPELSLEFYRKEGYFPRAVKVYMLTLLNSDFEEWYLKHPDAPLEDFPFKVEKMGKSGALFDLDKLNDISKNELSRLDAEGMLSFLRGWAEEFGTAAQKGYFADRGKMLRVLTLCMGIGGKKRRKDFVTASQAMEFVKYFFERPETFDEYRIAPEARRTILAELLGVYRFDDDSQTWFSKVKEVSARQGFAVDMKEYKACPEAWRGSVADVAEILRIAVTGKANTPDLWSIMQILGEDEVRTRIEEAIG